MATFRMSAGGGMAVALKAFYGCLVLIHTCERDKKNKQQTVKANYNSVTKKKKKKLEEKLTLNLVNKGKTKLMCTAITDLRWLPTYNEEYF